MIMGISVVSVDATPFLQKDIWLTYAALNYYVKADTGRFGVDVVSPKANHRSFQSLAEELHRQDTIGARIIVRHAVDTHEGGLMLVVKERGIIQEAYLVDATPHTVKLVIAHGARSFRWSCGAQVPYVGFGFFVYCTRAACANDVHECVMAQVDKVGYRRFMPSNDLNVTSGMFIDDVEVAGVRARMVASDCRGENGVKRSWWAVDGIGKHAQEDIKRLNSSDEVWRILTNLGARAVLLNRGVDESSTID